MAGLALTHQNEFARRVDIFTEEIPAPQAFDKS
jgi:hypothetical protein